MTATTIRRELPPSLRSASRNFGENKSLLKRTGEEQLCKLTCNLFRIQTAFGLVPLVDPVDHAKQGQRRCSCAHFAFRLTRLLHLLDDAFHKMHVLLLSVIDPFSKRWRQRMVLVEHDRDFTIPNAEHYVDMQANESA